MCTIDNVCTYAVTIDLRSECMRVCTRTHTHEHACEMVTCVRNACDTCFLSCHWAALYIVGMDRRNHLLLRCSYDMYIHVIMMHQVLHVHAQ